MNNFEKIFTSHEFLTVQDSFNEKAGKIYEEDSSEFALMAMKSVDESMY